MSMTVVVTRNVPDRYRGFLASVMLEVSPGTYVSPDLSKGVRERVWSVCREWSGLLSSDGSVTMVWRDVTAPCALRIENCGVPKTRIEEHDGIWMDHHELTAAQEKSVAGQKDKPALLIEN